MFLQSEQLDLSRELLEVFVFVINRSEVKIGELLSKVSGNLSFHIGFDYGMFTLGWRIGEVESGRLLFIHWHKLDNTLIMLLGKIIDTYLSFKGSIYTRLI